MNSTTSTYKQAMTIYNLVRKNARITPSKTAIIFGNEFISYQQLIKNVDSLSRGLSILGISEDSCIAFFSPNSLDYAYVLLACSKLGCSVAPLPITTKGTALKQAMTSTRASHAIAWHTTARDLACNGLLKSRHIISLGQEIEGTIAFNDLLDTANAEDTSYATEPSTDNNFILTLTSGSTGQPKPIVFSQETKIRRALDATQKVYGLDENDVFLVSTPLYHSLAQRSLLAPLILGASCVILPKFSISAWFKAVEMHRVTFMFSVSSQLNALLPSIASGLNDLSSLRCLVSSSATLEEEDKKQLLANIKCSFHECYGASEMGVISDFDITLPKAPTASVGKSLTFVDLKILDENQKPLNPYEIGEIACKSLTAFKGYYLQPELTKSAHTSDGFFLTGDLGYLDNDGYLYFAGRKKDMIKSGGISIYPADIEAIVKTLKDVEECAAVGIPDKQLGEVICLTYTTHNKEAINELEMFKLLTSELLDYQLPRKIIHFHEFPKTEMGKILKPAIRDQIQKQLSV